MTRITLSGTEADGKHAKTREKRGFSGESATEVQLPYNWVTTVSHPNRETFGKHFDPQLAALIEAWPLIPEPVKERILGLAEGVRLRE